MPGKNPGVAIAIFIAVGGWLTYDMMTTRETQSTVVVMQYVFLAGIAIGLIGSVIRIVRSQ